MDAQTRVYDPKKNETNYYAVQLIKIDPNTSTNNVTNDRSFNGANYTWRLGISGMGGVPEDTTGKKLELWVNFQAVSPDLEKFYKSLDLIKTNNNDSFTEPTTPFYNVKGGAGIFAIGARDTMFILKLN